MIRMAFVLVGSEEPGAIVIRDGWTLRSSDCWEGGSNGLLWLGALDGFLALATMSCQ
jgi:hypothetical protein